jgi:hypothetical protein
MQKDKENGKRERECESSELFSEFLSIYLTRREKRELELIQRTIQEKGKDESNPR